MKVLRNLVRFCLVGAITLFSFTIQAQPGPGGGRPCADPPCGPPGDPDPPGRVPIGGLEILIAAGAALGAGKLALKKNANQPK